MHIVQLANFYGPKSGGLKVAVDQLAARYVAAGNRCTLIVPSDVNSVTADGGRDVIRIRSPHAPGLGGYRVIVNRHAVRRAIRSLMPDIIELSDKTTLPGVAAWARRRGVATVLISHERLDAVLGGVVSTDSLVRACIGRYNARLARRVDAIVCASDFAAGEFQPDFASLIRRIPLGVDLETFRVTRCGSSDRDSGVARLVSVVRLSPDKCPSMAIETLRVLIGRGVEAELTMFGDGPLRGQLEASSVGLPVTFAGHLDDRNELANRLSQADVAIAPGPHETFGLAALEVLACGTPLVTSARGALPELIVEGTGLCAEPDPEAFADAVCLLLAGDRGTQRDLARRRAEDFGWDRSASDFIALYEQFVRH